MFSTAWKVVEYCWGMPLDRLNPPYDFVVACDCVYVERLVEDLVSSMASVSDRGTAVLVASEKREEITYAKFRERMARDFTVRPVSKRHMNKSYDHENSEVLLCKLRRGAYSKRPESGRKINNNRAGMGRKQSLNEPSIPNRKEETRSRCQDDGHDRQDQGQDESKMEPSSELRLEPETSEQRDGLSPDGGSNAMDSPAGNAASLADPSGDAANYLSHSKMNIGSSQLREESCTDDKSCSDAAPDSTEG